nr:ribonuclease H-like domain-containing protein [Tanacetum cinerariifolium]
MNQFYDMKRIKREFSVARTPQQNGVAERKNRTLIEAAKTMDYLGKFDEKANEGFFVGYFVVSKAMRVFTKRTRIAEETLNIRFLKNAPNVKGNKLDWLFDINSLTISMNYVPIVIEIQTNGIAGTKDNIVASQAKKKKEPEQEYILIPICTTDPLISQGSKDNVVDAGKKATEVDESQVSNKGGQEDQITKSEFEGLLQQEKQTEHIKSTNSFNTVSSPAHPFERFSPFKNAFSLPHVPIMNPINDTGIFGNAYDDEAVEEEVDMNNVFCDMKGIKREFSVARTPQQNGVAERKNKTLIEAARTMLADFKLPTTFWAEAVNIACYVLNRALVIKPHNKTPYELIRGRPPLINFMKPFRCPVTILNTRDYLGKFDEKANEGFFVGYSVVNWLFDIDSLTISMNYMPVVAGFQTNGIAGTKHNFVAGQAKKRKEPKQEYILISICTTDPLISQGPKDSAVDAGKKATEVDESQVLNNGGSPVNTVGPSFVSAASPSPINAAGTPASTNAFEEHPFEQFSLFKNAFSLLRVPIMTLINDTRIFGNAYDDEAVEEEDELLQFKLLNVWTLVDLRKDKWEISTKWIFRNKKDDRGIVIKNKARLVAQRHTREEGIDYDEVFAPVARIEAIRLFLAYSSFKDFVVYQMDVKSDFLYEKIEEEDAEAEDVDVHLYRSMIGSLMYLTTSKPDITFAVCACAWFQVNPKTSHLHVVKRIFRYLKGQPKLGLWYPKDSPLDLEAYFDSNYARASHNKKSTTGDETIYKERKDRMERDATTASSLELEQESEKPSESEGFKQIIDFLNAKSIRYALTVNPIVYASCVKQFWTTANMKKVNGQEQIQALVDKQK